MSAILKITDGTTSVDLLYGPFHLNEWRPAVAEYKDGGVMSDSPIIDGSRLAFKRFASASEALDLKLATSSQDQAALNMRRLQTLLESATSYWTNLTDTTQVPVYIEARASKETEKRYAVILNYSLPELENQYAQPFLQPQGRSVYDNISLTLLRGDWLGEPPGTATALSIGSRLHHNLVTNPGFETWVAGSPSGWTDVGTPTLTETETGSDSGQARILIEATGATEGVYQDISVTGAGFGGSVPPTDYIISVTVELVSGTARLEATDGGTNNNPVSVDLTTVGVEQVLTITKANTTGGVRIRLLCTDGSSAYFDNVLAGHYYGNVDGDGVLSTTTDAKSVFHTNKHTYANLTHIIYWDGAAFSANLYGSDLKYEIGPNPIADGDYILFGIETLKNEISGPFTSIVLDVGDAATITGSASSKWQYWDGAWQDLTTRYDYTNRLQGHTGNNPFKLPGLNSVHWNPPIDWVVTSFDSVQAYWVRVLYTVPSPPGDAVATPAVQTFQPYTITIPYIEMQSDQVSGDLPMLAQFITQDRCLGFWAGAERLFAGLRTQSRGDEFTAYLNMSDAQVPLFMDAEAGLGGAFVDYTWAPTGRAYQVTATDEFTLTIKQSHARQYTGKYRAFIRLYQTSGTPDEVTVRLTIKSEQMTIYQSAAKEIPWDPAGQTTATSMDFGEIDLPGVDLLSGDRLSNIKFIVNTTNASARTINYYDIVLLPIDEWSGAYINDGTFITYYASTYGEQSHVRLDVDSIAVPRRMVRPTLRMGENDIVIEPWIHRQSGPTIWSNAGTQKMWFYYYNLIGTSEDQAAADPHLAYSAVAYKAERFLTPRGAE